MELHIQLLILFTSVIPAYVETQTNEDFNCTFSGCVGESVVCYCSVNVNVSECMIQWWDDQATLCQTFLSNSGPFTSVGLRAEVVSGSTHPTCAITSKLTLNVSTEHNGTEVGCTRLPSNSCTPSNTDPNIFEFLLLVKDCSEISVHTAPSPPRNLSLTMEPNAQCNSSVRNISLSWEEPETSPSLLPVTYYNLSYTTEDRENCSELLPASATSYNLLAVAGVLYTVTVSAITTDIESQSNPQLNFVTVKVVDESSFENNATILLQVGNTTSNFTINYAPCSKTSDENYTSKASTPDLEIHLVNLNAETVYCYSITADSNTVVTGSCKGKVTTTAEDTSILPPTTLSISDPPTSNGGVNVGAIVGSIIAVPFSVLVSAIFCVVLWLCCKKGSSLQVSITPGANPTAGQSYTFTCTVTPLGGLTGTPTVQWRGPGSSDPISTGGDFTVSSTPPYTLTINPLRQSHDGQYTCQATIGATTGSSSATLTVAET